MEITEFTDLWIIHFSVESYAQYKSLIRAGEKDKLKNWIISRYIKNYTLKYLETGKPLIIAETDAQLYLSFADNKNAAVLLISSEEVGVDVIGKNKNVINLVIWACPWKKTNFLLSVTKSKLAMYSAQKTWCRIEAIAKLYDKSLLHILSERNEKNVFKQHKDVHFKTIISKEFICVIAKRKKVVINQIFNVDFHKIQNFL